MKHFLPVSLNQYDGLNVVVQEGRQTDKNQIQGYILSKFTLENLSEATTCLQNFQHSIAAAVHVCDQISYLQESLAALA